MCLALLSLHKLNYIGEAEAAHIVSPRCSMVFDSLQVARCDEPCTGSMTHVRIYN